MKKKILSIGVILTTLFFIACGGGEANNSDSSESGSESTSESSTPKDVDLSEHGIPLTLTVPAGSEVSQGMLNGEIEGIKMYNVDIKKDKFYLSVLMTDVEEEGQTLQAAVASEKEDVEIFNEGVEFISEDANGFIYKYDEDGDANYGFSYIAEKEGNFILIEAGLSFSTYSKEQIQEMYNAAKTAK